MNPEELEEQEKKKSVAILLRLMERCDLAAENGNAPAAEKLFDKFYEVLDRYNEEDKNELLVLMSQIFVKTIREASEEPAAPAQFFKYLQDQFSTPN